MLVQALILTDFLLSQTPKAKIKTGNLKNKAVLYDFALQEDDVREIDISELDSMGSPTDIWIDNLGYANEVGNCELFTVRAGWEVLLSYGRYCTAT